MRRTPPRRSARNMQSNKNVPAAIQKNSAAYKSTAATTTITTTSSSITAVAAQPSSISQVSLEHTLHIPSATTTKASSLDLPINFDSMPFSTQQNLPAQPLPKGVESNAGLRPGTAADKVLATPPIPLSEDDASNPEPTSPIINISMQPPLTADMLSSMQNQIAIWQRQIKEAEVRLGKSECGKNKDLVARPTNVFSATQATSVVSSSMPILPTMSSTLREPSSYIYTSQSQAGIGIQQRESSNMLLTSSQHNVLPNSLQHNMLPNSLQQNMLPNMFMQPMHPATSQAHAGAHIQRDSNMFPNALQQNMLTQPVYMHPTTFTSNLNNLNNNTSSYVNSPAQNSVDSAIQMQRVANNDLNVLGSTMFRKKLIDLPEFSGQPEEWPIFYTAYVESTAAYGYTKFENNQRLYKCLKGEAREVVKSLLIHPNNVSDAVEHLRTRFGRPEFLIRSQLKQIREVSPISENSISKLIQFATTTKNLAIFLQSINGEQHLANPTLLEELVRKLPMSKRVEWARRASTILPYPNIQHFSDWLSEIAALISVVLDNEPREHRQRAIFHVSETQNNTSIAVKCSICKAKHKIYECKQFLDAHVSERWSMVKQHKLCFSCLNYGHSTRDCRRRKPCVINNCGKRHNKLLHEYQSASRTDRVNPTDCPRRVSDLTNDAVLNCKVNMNTRNKLLFRVLPVTLHGPNKSIDVYALLDEGSSVTMVDKDVLNKLGVDGQRKQLDIQWFGGRSIQEPTVLVDIHISGHGMRKRHKLRNIYGVGNLNLPTQTLSERDLENLKFEDKVMPPLYSEVTPKILIGLDHCHLGLPTQSMSITGNGPYAAHTELGWVIFGQTNRVCEPSATCLVVHSSRDLELHDIVSDYFKTENFGVKASPPILSADDERANAIMEATTLQIDGRFQAGLLWKSDDIILPESYTMALKRLVGIEKKMKRNAEFATAYSGIMDSYVKKGYARKVLADEIATYHPRIWYLPHFAVVNPNKPMKLRLVFDAAACSNGTSLNSHLLKGPQKYRPLAAILFHFREGRVAVCGDIMEMFHQIVVQPSDRCAQRFLWRGGDDTKPPDVYEMVAMTFGAACSPCLAHHVKTVNALRHRHADNLRAVKAILEHHYVDDFVDSFESVDEAIKVTKQVREIHKHAGFILRNFTSNSPEVIKSLGGKNLTLDIKCKETFASEKVLGMYWQPSSDDFNFEVKFNYTDQIVLDGLRCPTKREILSIVMSIFDPLGFLCHFTIGAKLLLREVWRHHVRWDEYIPAEVNAAWERFRQQLPNVTRCHVPRHYFSNAAVKQLQLHVFVDASEDAFAAVAYWRFITVRDTINVSFICAKTRTAPLKPLTMPRLELQAAVLGTRLMKTIFNEHSLRIDDVFLWSDSSTVLHWINSENRRYKPFVAHRIAEILEGSKQSQWRWVSTFDNVADEGTRAKCPTDFSPSSRWFNGPAFLKIPQESWHVRADIGKMSSRLFDGEEIRPKFTLMVARNILIDYSRFSSFTKLRRTIAWILRFISACRKQKTKEQTYGLTALELDTSQLTLCRLVQEEVYSSQLNDIANKQPVARDSELYQLCPYMDENRILRVYGRIDAAICLPYQTKRPIILPAGHAVTKLVVAYNHEKMLHQNTEATITEIRRTFWVPRLRQVLRSVISNCAVCKIRRVKPVVPLMGSLPQDRLTPYVRPFTFTGLDYFGPINVSIGRRTEKRWVALFTCLTVRAIHLELAQDLSTDSCILCIRNFINRRGVPARLRSDNGTNFIGADREAKRFTQVFDCEKIQNELSSRGVEWTFNWPSNPSEGGAWERMVQSVKRALWHTLKEESPKEHTLISVLVEIENVVNSRPLTHIPVTSEQEEPLTPNHFLLGSPNTANTPSVNDPIQKLCSLRKQWRVARQYRDRFWKRWIAEYLPTLTRRVKWCRRERALRVGDLVFVCDSNTPRRGWCRGRVVQVYQGSDGEIRRAEVRTSSGVLRRPASKLAILDVGDGETERSTGWGM